MADIIGVYASGTTGALDGTLISYSGTRTQPYVIAAMETPYTLHYRTIDSVTLDDAGKDTNASFTVTMGSGMYVAASAGASYSATISLPAAVGANKPFAIKQSSGVAASAATFEVGTGGVTFASGTRLSAPTLSAEGGDASVTLTIGALSGETGFHVERATDSGFTANLVRLTSSLAADSTSYVNNSTNGNTPVYGTTYYYRVRAYDANGAGAWSDTASATVTTWTLDFAAGAADNLTRLPGSSAQAVSGSGKTFVADNKLTILSDGATGSAAALRYFGDAIDTSKTQRFTLREQVVSAPNSLNGAYLWAGSAPSCQDSSTLNTHNLAGIAFISTASAVITYYNGSASRYWNFGTNEWGTTSSAYSYSMSASTDYTLIVTTNTSGIQFTLADASGTAVSNGSATLVAWSAINVGGTYPGTDETKYIWTGEGFTNVCTCTIYVKLAKYEVL